MNLNDDAEKLRQAHKAGRRSTKASPYQREERNNARTWVLRMAVLTFQTYVGLWLASHHAPLWVVATYWVQLGLSAVTIWFLAPSLSKARRRHMMMAREQVHRIRQLDPDRPGAKLLNLDVLHEINPGLDRDSARAGSVFTIGHILAILDEVDAETPKAKIFGIEVDDDGKLVKK